MKIESLMQALNPVTQIDNFPITVRHLQALLFLATQAEPIDQGEARKRLGYHGPCMSRSVDTLGILGFAKRARNNWDRRRSFITITPKGRDFIAKLCEPSA
jgi:DNA-binding MarR family transcriptional regulator